MYENTTPAEQVELAKAGIARVADLEQQVKNLIEDRDNWEKRHVDLEEIATKYKTDRDYYSDLATQRYMTIANAREAIEEVLSGDIDAKQTFDDFQTAFELLGVSLSREVEIEVTMTWRGTITVPYDVDPEDLSINDFASCDPDHSYYETNFHDGLHDHTIREL